MGCRDTLWAWWGWFWSWFRIVLFLAAFYVSAHSVKLVRTLNLWYAYAYGQLFVHANNTAAYERFVFG